MKISNSKKELARIISENGGWREGNHAIQDKDDKCVWFMTKVKGRPSGKAFWPGCKSDRIKLDKLLPNWHQTILSRDEYFHLYPVVAAAPGTAPDPVVEAKPTIEQLAADYRNAKDHAERKQEEADAAKADADARLAKLVAAGKAHGLVLSVADAVNVEPEPELVITDWRDLLEGDEVSVQHMKNVYSKSTVLAVGVSDVLIQNHAGVRKTVNLDERDWSFIRRP